MKALTVKQPWAWAIAAGHKLVENRSWTPPVGMLAGHQTIYIHAAAAAPTRADLELMLDKYGVQPGPHELVTGAIIARVVLGGVLRDGQNKLYGLAGKQLRWWNRDLNGWVLQDVTRLTVPYPCKGQLGLWNAPDLP